MAMLMTSIVRAEGLLRMADHFTKLARVGNSLGGQNMNEKAKIQAYESFALHLQNTARGVNVTADGPGLNERLALTSTALQLVDKDRAYEPSPAARRLIAIMAAPLDADSFLLELLNAELNDFRQESVNRAAAARKAVSERDSLSEAVERERSGRLAAERLRESLQADVNAMTAELSKLRGQVAYLQATRSEDEESAPAPTPGQTFVTVEQIAELDSKRRVQVGNGLVIERHNGSVWFKSRQNSGDDWIADVKSMSIEQAQAARDRITSAQKGVK